MYRSMPPRPRGKMHRGGMRGGYGGGHWERGHGGRGGGGGGYRGRGRGGGPRGGRPDYYHGHGRRGSRSPPPRQHHDHEKLLAGLGPEAQLALTTAIINSVLKTDGREGRGSYRERDRIHHRDARRDGRGGYFREESRERRHYGDERRSHDPRQYHEEGRGHRYEREKSTSGSPRYRNNRYSGMPRRRPSPHGHPGPSRKRQRVERMDSGEGGSTPHHEHEFEGEEEVYDQERERERPRERRHRSPGDEEQRKGREGEGSKDEDDKEGSDGRGGVQVTIRADGERAVNSEGHVRSRVSGRIFVDLKCPHCPSQKSITFKEYKFHLGSDGHKNQLNRLARKHSVVLRKIRIQQRQEQRDIEEKWKEDKGEDFKNAVSKFCSTCKLAFKCLGSNVSDGISLHSRSKLHRMQRHYLHPRCGICRITFPSRMVYEYHIASINHLRVRTATVDNHGGDHRSDEHDDEDDDDALDLTNFMTLDSVGEDDEEVGSEHEEITEGLEEVEAAEEGSLRKTSSKSTKRKKGQEEEEISVEADWDKEQLDEDEDEEGNEAVGTEYVNRIEAYFCSLCCKIIRGGTSLGSRSVQRHCRSYDHLAHYQDAHPPKAEEKQEASADEGEDKLDNANVEDKEEVVKTKEHKEVDHEPEEGDYEGEEGDYEAEEEDFEGEEGDYDGEEDVDEGEEEADEGEAGEADEGEAEEADEGEAEEADNLEDPTDDDPEQEKLWKEVDKGLTELQGEIMNEIGEKSQDEKMDVDHHAEVEEESGNEEENEGNDSETQQNHSEDEEEVENVEENKEAEVDDDGADDGDDDDNDHAESQSAVEEHKEVGNGSDSE